MISLTNKITLVLFSALLFLAAGYYAYTQNIFVLVMAVGLIAGLYLVQHPEQLFYLLMIAIPWSMEYNFTPSLGTDLPDEPLMLVCAASLLFFLSWNRRKMGWKNVHPLVFIIALQFSWMMVTVITSTDPVLSLKYGLAKSWYLLAFVGMPLILFRSEKIFKRSVIFLVSSMLLLTLVTMVRHWHYDFAFEDINGSLEPFFRNHVNYSALLVFTVPIQIAFARLASNKRVKLFFYSLIILTVLALYFSYSRGAWLALGFGLISFWLLKKRLLIFAFIFSMVMVTVAFLFLGRNERFLGLSNDYRTTIFHTDFREHLIATYRLKDMSNAERMNRWIAGARMIKDSWKTGLGPSSFYSQYKPYTLPAFKTYVSNNPEHSTVHNYFLLMLIEQGIIGLLLFITLVGSLFWYAQKIYQRAEGFWKLVAATVASILVMECLLNFLSDMIETDKVGSIFYLCIATLIIADIKTRKKILNFSADIQSIS